MFRPFPSSFLPLFMSTINHFFNQGMDLSFVIFSLNLACYLFLAFFALSELTLSGSCACSNSRTRATNSRGCCSVWRIIANQVYVHFWRGSQRSSNARSWKRSGNLHCHTRSSDRHAWLCQDQFAPLHLSCLGWGWSHAWHGNFFWLFLLECIQVFFP